MNKAIQILIIAGVILVGVGVLFSVALAAPEKSPNFQVTETRYEFTKTLDAAVLADRLSIPVISIIRNTTDPTKCQVDFVRPIETVTNEIFDSEGNVIFSETIDIDELDKFQEEQLQIYMSEIGCGTFTSKTPR